MSLELLKYNEGYPNHFGISNVDDLRGDVIPRDKVMIHFLGCIGSHDAV